MASAETPAATTEPAAAAPPAETPEAPPADRVTTGNITIDPAVENETYETDNDSAYDSEMYVHLLTAD